ncbi:MAG: AraC family transcriptional regulator [Actinomycetota bacterium]
MQPDFDGLLSSRVVLRTDSIADLHAYIAGMEVRLRRTDESRGPVAIELRHAPLGRIDVGLLLTNISLNAESARTPDAPFLVQLPLHGGCTLEIDGCAVAIPPGSGTVISPGQHVRRSSEPGTTLLLSVTGSLVRSRIELHTRRALDRPLVFEPLIESDAETIRQYWRLMAEAIDRDVAVAGGPLARVLEEGLVDLLLRLQPHSHWRSFNEAEATARSHLVEIVAAHVDAHLAEPLSVQDLAAIAGCSVRVLQSILLELQGTTPVAFVRCRRRAAARKMLENSDSGMSITETAQRCGFLQLGRFSVEYKATYGESPSQTKQRVAMHRKSVAVN